MTPSTHRQWMLKGYHSFDKLELNESVPVPEPQGSEILVQMKAASLNYRDVAIVHKTYPPGSKEDLVPLSDGAGIVTSLGPNATRFKVGDKVIPMCTPRWITGRADWTRSIGNQDDGVLQDYVIVEQDGLFALPSNHDFVQGSTLACAALTAWNALYGLKSKAIMPGDWVLTEGTGGVSLFAVQFAKAAGARVVATTSSDDKAQTLRDLGADHIINYRTHSNWGEMARDLTPGKVGFDHIVDVAGAGTLGQVIRAISQDGVISLIGFMGKGETPDLMSALYGQFIVRGVGIGSRAQADEMVRAIEATDLKPVVDRVFEFKDARDAYKHLEDQGFVGKVVIKYD